MKVTEKMWNAWVAWVESYSTRNKTRKPGGFLQVLLAAVRRRRRRRRSWAKGPLARWL